jgi:hypothetical protein
MNAYFLVMNSEKTVHLMRKQSKARFLPSACCLTLAAADKMNNLNSIALVDFGVFPIVAPDELSIHFDGDSLW